MIQSEHTTDVGIDISSSFVNAQSILDYRIENTNIDLQQERDDCDVNDVNDDGEDYERDNQSYNKIVMKIPDMRRSTMDSYVTTMKNVAPPPKMILPQIKEFNIDMMNNAEKKQKKVRKQ
jgi:hypothetical protein